MALTLARSLGTSAVRVHRLGLVGFRGLTASRT